MSRRYITELSAGESVDEVFLAGEKQLRTNRNGNLYVQLRLSDRSGSITAMLWNASERQFNAFDNGDFVRIVGATQVYNGGLQIIANRIERMVSEKVDESDFITLTRGALDELSQRLAEMLRAVRNPHLRNLAECFLMDDDFMRALAAAPAGVKNHHAYRGGLLQHIVELMELVAVVSPRYDVLDDDLMLVGAFLHDVGKIRELSFERELGYTDEGQLVGHMVIAIEMLGAKVREAEKLAGEEFPAPLLLRLKHVILSHHGQYEFGSPKLPMTVEALALHYLDSLDAKLHQFVQVMREDVNAESQWTTFQPNLGRKILKAALPDKLR